MNTIETDNFVNNIECKTQQRSNAERNNALTQNAVTQ